MLVVQENVATGIGEVVGQTANLCALAAVGTAATQQFACLAATAVAHTQGTVHEALHGHLHCICDG